MSLLSTNNLTGILLKVVGLFMSKDVICLDISNSFILDKLNGFIIRIFPLVLRILGWSLIFDNDISDIVGFYIKIRFVYGKTLYI